MNTPLVTATLTPESFLREIFPEGIIPIEKPTEDRGLLGGSTTPEPIYFLALAACTPEQVEAIAKKLSELGQGTVAQAREYLASKGNKLPIRKVHVASVGISLRAFI